MAKTLAEKIAVMQAAERGEEIEIRACGCANWHLPAQDFAWNWRDYDYRVKPKPQKFWVVFNDKNQLVAATNIPISDNAKFGWINNKCVVEEYEREE